MNGPDEVRQVVSIGLFGLCLNQILANRGPDSRFVLKAIIKALISKLSQSSIKIKADY